MTTTAYEESTSEVLAAASEMARPETAASAPITGTRFDQLNLAVRKALISCGVWLLYVPHLTLILVLGPWLGLRWTRLVAWAHWLLTFLGAQRELHRVLTRLYPTFDTDLSVRTLIRKNLELKHQSFAEWRLATTRRGRRYIKKTYQTFDYHRQYVANLDTSHGALVLSYHYGMYKLLGVGLSTCYGFDYHQIDFRSAHYSTSALGPIARLAFRNAIKTAEGTGTKFIFLGPESSPLGIVKRLRKGGILAIAGDGMISSEFTEVPFLGETLRLPTGWARLAALTRVPVVIMFATMEGIDRRNLVVLPPLYCEDNTDEAVHNFVARCAETLEDFVRRRPWAWHIWHRMKLNEDRDGHLHLRVDPVVTDAERVHSETSSS